MFVFTYVNTNTVNGYAIINSIYIQGFSIYLSYTETVEEEAVRILQYNYKKWKMWTLLEKLRAYRDDKMQHLVYFSQQV